MKNSVTKQNTQERISAYTVLDFFDLPSIGRNHPDRWDTRFDFVIKAISKR